jgi:uncharacterized protein (DUF305 family)
MMKCRYLSATLVAGGALIAACGGGDDEAADTLAPVQSVPSISASGAASGAATAFNDADVAFAQGMIGHHEQAIEMAEIALDPNAGASPEVLDLAGRIQSAQGPEIDLLTGWLTSWGQPVQMDASAGHDMASMEGMMTAEEMDQLATLSGPEFDTMWMEMMIRHHQGAIAQSETVKAAGSNPEALALADQIIAAQSGEITEMEALLAS